MKAIICNTYGPPSTLTLEEIQLPAPKENEVQVELKACSVNFPDTLIIQGKYQVKPPLPFTPGSDIAGVVMSVGENVKHLKVGDEVFGFTISGGYAEAVNVDAKSIFPKPPQMDFPIAASFLLAYGTSYHALVDRAQLKAGETLVVLGASGGVGLAAVEIAKQLGAKVIACASTSDKLELCQSKGADEIINYNEEDLKNRIKELTNGKGADVIYDPVGSHYSEAALRAMAWEGRFLVVGFAAGEIPKIPLNLTLLKGCSIVGVFWGSFATKQPKDNLKNTYKLVEWYTTGKIKPHIDAVYPLADAPQALQDMMDRKIRGKVVIKCS